jgi:hypothetical protein
MLDLAGYCIELDSDGKRVEWNSILGNNILTTVVPDPQSWMALLRREIGHFHEKKELPLDTRSVEGCGGMWWVGGCPEGFLAIRAPF